MLTGLWLFTIDKWNEKMDGWLVSLLWAPHYVVAVIACLTGLLILWKGAGRARVKQIGGIVVAAIAFAGSTGTAIYIALVFAAPFAVFGLVALFKRWWDDVFAIAISGTLAVVFATPYMLGLFVGGAQAGRGERVPRLSLIRLPQRCGSFPELDSMFKPVSSDIKGWLRIVFTLALVTKRRFRCRGFVKSL